MKPKQPGLITVKEARKLLGKQAEHMSDDLIEELIFSLTTVGARYLQAEEVPKN
jgi:hypothetical protein